MAQVLDLSKSVYEICTKYPVIKGLMAENGFAEITEPGRLQTMGRFMTIPKGCDHKGVDLEELKAIFRAHGFTILGDEEPAAAEAPAGEKPAEPESNLASMGIYIFTTDLLLETLREDAKNPESSHDFGKDIIPTLLDDGKRLFTYRFEGFWRDVGTIASYHETSMDLLGSEPKFDIFSDKFPILSNASTRPPAYIGAFGEVDDCLVSNGCQVFGYSRHSILSTDAVIGEGARVIDSVLLPGAEVKPGAVVIRAILGENAVVEKNVHVGSSDLNKEIAVVGNDVVVERGEH